MPPTPSLLILDAEAHQGVLMARILGRAGLRVDVAHDAAQALGLLEKQNYTFVLVDAAAPGRAAHRLLAALQARSPATKCLVLIHERTSRRAEEFQALGAWATIQQPANIDALKMLLTERPSGRLGTSAETESDYRRARPA